MIAFCDADDYPELALYRWTASPSNGWRKRSPNARVKWYACRWEMRSKKKIKIYMHRQIMKAPKHLVVDHLDGNSLNNTRANLRRCTQKTNCFSRIYEGVDRSDEWS